jgi:hypothetical protein
MAKGKETKGMRRWASLRREVLGQICLRADCAENVPSVPGFLSPDSQRSRRRRPISLANIMDMPRQRRIVLFNTGGVE